MFGHQILVDDMVRIVLALEVGSLIGKLTFIEMVEESIEGHYVCWIKGTAHCFTLKFTHSIFL
jgi:hypothetical protein